MWLLRDCKHGPGKASSAGITEFQKGSGWKSLSEHRVQPSPGHHCPWPQRHRDGDSVPGLDSPSHEKHSQKSNLNLPWCNLRPFPRLIPQGSEPVRKQLGYLTPPRCAELEIKNNKQQSIQAEEQVSMEKPAGHSWQDWSSTSARGMDPAADYWNNK